MKNTFEDLEGNLKPRKKIELSDIENNYNSSTGESLNVDKFLENEIGKLRKIDFLGLDPLSKTARELQKKMMHLGFEAKAKQYNLMVETGMKLRKERAEAALMSYSAISRQGVAAVVLSKVEELRSIVFENEKRFLIKLEEQEEFAKNITNDRRKLRYQRKIEEEEIRHFEFLDSVIDKFLSIMNQKISDFQ